MRQTAPLTGRATELAALREVVDVHADTDARAAVVTGEAGAGKSRLVDEAIAAAAPPPDDVIRVRGGELTSTLPFAALRRGLRRALGDDDRVTDLLEGHRGAQEQDTTRALLVDAFTEVIERRAIHRPVLLVVDDAHWLDQPTLSVLDLLARQLGSTALRLVIAARPHPRPSGLDSVHRTLRRAGVLTAIDLEPLAQADAHRITEALLGGRATSTVHALVDRAGGNPLYCTELGLALRDRVVRTDDGRLDLDRQDAAAELDVIEHNLAGLGPAVRTLLVDAALLGTAIEPAHLALLVDRPVPEVLADLGPALRAGVLAEDRDGLIAFRHDLVRDAVLAAVPRALAAARHRDAVHALGGAGLHPAAWVAHLRLADWTGAPSAWHWFEQGGEALASQSLDAAADLLDHALRSLPGEPPISFVSLQLERLLETDRLPELRDLLTGLLQRDPTSIQTSVAAVDRLALRVFHARWMAHGAHRDVETGPWLRALTARGSATAGDVADLDRLMADTFGAGHESRLDDYLHIMHRAEGRGDQRLALTARYCAAYVAILEGRPDRCEALTVGGLEQQLASGGSYLWGLVGNLFVAEWTSTCDGTPDHLFERIAPVAERLGPPASHMIELVHVRRLLRSGEWAAAAALADAVASDDRGVNLPTWARSTYPALAWAGTGRAEVALELLERTRAFSLTPSSEDRLQSAVIHRNRAVVHLLDDRAGADARAREHAGAALRQWLACAPSTRTRFEPALWAALGALTGYEEEVSTLAATARDTDLHPFDRTVLTALTEGWSETSHAAAEHALATHEFLVLEALAAVAPDPDARELLGASHGRALASGATAWAARLGTALTERGGTPTSTPGAADDDGLAALTPAERRVLPLILDGLLYREIAEELHNSRRTIESHAASIMRKLGVSSRRELGDVVVHDEVTAPV